MHRFNVIPIRIYNILHKTSKNNAKIHTESVKIQNSQNKKSILNNGFQILVILQSYSNKTI